MSEALKVSEVECSKSKYGDGYISYHPKMSDFIGRVFTEILVDENGDNGDQIIFQNASERFTFYHDQSCCEDVSIESIVGSMADLIGHPILMAEEATSEEDPEGVTKKRDEWDSYTWTFYKFATIKGYVDVRWCGHSNGYYSEAVDLRYEKREGK